MEGMSIVYAPIFLENDNRWKINDYKVRILNKINHEKVINRDTKLVNLENIERLVIATMKRFRINDELEALIFINKELTIKQMERYNAKYNQQNLQCR
jgi:hypothetical protein